MAAISTENGLGRTILSIANILMGIVFMIIILLMQGVFAFLLGLLYVILGVIMLSKKSYFWVLYCGVIPITLMFSLNIIMMGVSKNIPKYYQTPLWVGIPLLIPFWLICFFDIIFLNKYRKADK